MSLSKDIKEDVSNLRVEIFDPPLYLQRYCTVKEILLKKFADATGPIKVCEFGCAELSFFTYLKNIICIENVICVDVDKNVLESNTYKVKPFLVNYLDKREKPLNVTLLQGSIDKPDAHLDSVNAVICIEVIEHLYPDVFEGVPHNIFHFIEPDIAIFTTPNYEFNVLFKPGRKFRCEDHKFEWTREQFESWAQNIILRYPKYEVSFGGIGLGPKGAESLGCCTQMAIFIKKNCDVESKSRHILHNVLVDENNESLFNKLAKNPVLCDYVSHGICTYHSKSTLLVNDEYKVIFTQSFPFIVTSDSVETIITNKIHKKLTNLGYYSNEDYIPLYKLRQNAAGEFISEDKLREILKKLGWYVGKHKINGQKTLCVFYHYQIDDEISSNSSDSCSEDADQISDATNAIIV